CTEHMDLSLLKALEREKVLEVLQRDKVLRSVEEERIRKLKLELQEIRRKGAKSFSRQYSERTCARCQRPLGKFWNCGAICHGCSHRICSKCRVSTTAQEWKCTVSFLFHREVKIKSGEWFMEERAKKFPGEPGTPSLQNYLKQLFISRIAPVQIRVALRSSGGARRSSSTEPPCLALSHDFNSPGRGKFHNCTPHLA
uniref:RabBD domain-containing protein n=1 Tax=Scleropages formosus TaxID=113540 RepID=A0A8C9WEN7_SCLFO